MEKITKKRKKGKPTEVFVEYVGRRLAKMIFRGSGKLYVYAAENHYIDLDMLPEPMANRNTVSKALEMLPDNLNPGVELKALIYPEDDDFVFVNAPTFTFIYNGKRIRWDEFVSHPYIFTKHVVPVLSYKEVQFLESTKKDLRLMISDERNGVWKTLFERDFPELYAPYILPPLYSSDINPEDDIMNGIRNNGLCLFLDKISKPGPRIGTKDPTIRPYWKLLYEFHLDKGRTIIAETTIQVHRFKHYHTLKLPENRDVIFISSGNERIIPYQLINSCAFYKDTTICMPNKMNKHFLNWKTADIIDLQKFCMDVTIDLFRNNNLIPNTQMLAFEQRLENTFISIWNPEKEKRIDRLFVDGDIFKSEDMRMGLIGETGYFMERTSKRESHKPERNIETVIVDQKNKVNFVFDYTKRIYTCYNTPSSCFVISATDDEDIYIAKWGKITDKGIEYIIPDTTVVVDMFDPSLPFTFNDKYVIVSFERNHVGIYDDNYKKCDFTFPNDYRITDMCIIGNRLYLFSSDNYIDIVDIPEAFKVYDDDTFEIIWSDAHIRYGIKNIFFDYVRMTSMGFVFCSTNPTRAPILISPNMENYKLTACKICNIACQTCQIPSQYRCKTCKTPTCSGEHLKCCTK